MSEGSTTQSTSSENVRARRGLPKWVYAAMFAVGVCIGIGYVLSLVLNEEQMRVAAQSFLQRHINAQVTIENASFSWFDDLRLQNVQIHAAPSKDRVPGDDAHRTQPPIFSCRELIVTPDFVSLLKGDIRIKTVLAVEPTCTIVRDAKTGKTNLGNLVWVGKTHSGDEWLAPPSLELRKSRVVVVQQRDGQDTLVEQIDLEVRGKLSAKDQGFYDVVWRRLGKVPASGHSQIDLATGRARNVEGGLPWMSVETVMIAVNAKYDTVGVWSDLLGLGGTVRVRDYDFGQGDKDDRPRSATIELDGARLSVPINAGEQLLPADQRYLRFESVRGYVELSADQVHAEFRGMFHGSPCHAIVTLRSGGEELNSLDDVDLEVHLKISNLLLPSVASEINVSEARFVNRWPKLAKFYRDFDPHGRLDIEFEASKSAGANQPLRVKGLHVKAVDADASWRGFPFRVSQLTGNIDITPEGTRIRLLQGKHDDGMVTVDGSFSRLGRGAAVDLRISGDRIPVDDALCQALSLKNRPVCRDFAPQGEIQVRTHLTRPESADERPAKWNVRNEISFTSLSAEYVKFPVPIDHLSGTVVSNHGRVSLQGLKGKVGHGSVDVAGEIVWLGRQLSHMDVTVNGHDILIEDTVISALPESVRDQVAAFRPQGFVQVTTRLTKDEEESSVNHQSTLVLQAVEIRHESFPIPIVDITGRLDVSATGIRLDDVRGKYGQSSISATGLIDQFTTQPSPRMTVQCAGLTLDERLYQHLPERISNWLSDWRVEGPIDLQVNLGEARTPPASNMRIVANLEGVTVKHPRFPLPFEDVQAVVTLDGGNVYAFGILAGYGDAQVQANVDASRQNGDINATVSMTVRGLPLDESSRNIFPDAVGKVWDKLDLSGRVDLLVDRLDYSRLHSSNDGTWSVQGQIALRDVAGAGVLDLRGAEGDMTIGGMLIDAQGATTLTGNLKLGSVQLLGRSLSNAVCPWSFVRVDDGDGQLTMDSFQAEIYNGSVTGQLRLMFGLQPANYHVSAIMYGVEVDSLINDNGLEDVETKKIDIGGVVDARVHLTGLVSDKRTRRGAGRVELREGHMYRLPLILAILNVINLTLPQEQAFQDAEVDFFVLGNRLELSSIVLRGAALALMGTGTVTLPDFGLNLNVINISPHQWARIPGLTDFLEGASRELVELHITGPVSAPTVKPRPLRGISEELKRLFQKRKPKPIRSAS